jgi:hypothetical protein
MRPVRPSTSTPRVHPAHLPLRGPDDALSVLLAGPLPSEPTVSVLLLDEQHCGISCLDIGGRADAPVVLEVAELLVLVAAESPLAAAVLGCIRPSGGHAPAADDLAAFTAARDQLADWGVDLLDCFLIGRGGSTSLAEISGAAWLWQWPTGGRPA